MAECPTCGDKFSSRRYMRSHHKQTHGKSIAGFDFTCAYCGKEGRKKQIKKRNEHEFCSRECYGNWRSENLSGQNSSSWEGRTVIETCDNCGNEVVKKLAQIEGFKNIYCSNECHYEHRVKTGEFKGERSPNWKEQLSVKCDNCGEGFRTTGSKLKRNKHHFCSSSCYGDWLSENNIRENHPRWKGGQGTDYGPNWRRQRDKAYKRDRGRCQVCGKRRTKLGTEAHVHHIIPVRKFKKQHDRPVWWQRANRLDNLVTLCKEHHTAWEGIPLRPQVAD